MKLLTGSRLQPHLFRRFYSGKIRHETLIFTGFLVFLLLRLGLLTPLRANEVFTPEKPPCIADSWRWRELEPLNQFYLIHGTEANDGTLYFSSQGGVVKYDGYTCEMLPKPDHLRNAMLLQIFASANGTIYVYSSMGLIAIRDGTWDLVRPFESRILEPRIQMAKSPRGMEVVSLPDGVYHIRGQELVLIPQIQENNIDELNFDPKNRLWIVLAQNNQIASYQFEGTRITSQKARKLYRLGVQRPVFSHLIASPKSEEVWCVNWRTGIPAYQYSETLDRWEPRDFTDISGSNGHHSGFSPNAEELVIFSKSALLVHKDEQWHSLTYPDYNIPTNQPFFFVRMNGNIIIGGRGESVHEITYSDDEYTSYQGVHFQCDSKDGKEWFIAIGGGIIEHSKTYDIWVEHSENVIDTPLTIIKSDDDVIWAAGAHRGQAAVCYFDGNEWILNTHPELDEFISHLSAQQLSNGDILFGSGDDEHENSPGGVVVYSKDSRGYHYRHITPPIFPARSVGFTEFANGRLWTGGTNLQAIDNTYQTAAMPQEPYTESSWIDHILVDDFNNAWLAQWDEGLSKFDGQNWVHFEAPAQIASNQVAFLLKDQSKQGGIWVATDRGISRFDGDNWYPISMPREFSFSREGGTLKQGIDGSVWINIATRNWYFRKTPGFNITKALHDNFRTIQFKQDKWAPKVEIMAHDSTTTSPANIFVQWSGIDKWSVTPSDQLKYTYRLGDGEWSHYTNRTNTILLDVEAGDHLFQVRAIDRNGNISTTPAQVQLSVTPPVWRTSWFLALVGFTLLIILALIGLMLRQRFRHLMQMEEFKLQFFTNISHELRTPLTVILGPLESQLKKLPEGWDKRPLKLAHRNAQKTLNLVDQILDFRSAETGHIKLNLGHADLVTTISEVAELIKPLADEQSQLLEFSINSESCLAWYDSEKLERILNNLIGNAVKFTPKHGKITVRVRIAGFNDSISAEIVVEDNGIGIPQGKIDSVFDVFYRAGNAPNPRLRGSGIGLAYTKNLIEAFSGTITVKSPITNVNGNKQGTRFTVTLPFNKYREIPTEGDACTNSSPAFNEANTHPPMDEKTVILIAEDDIDIREFIVSELSDSYEVLEAPDGEQALKIAVSQIPDLILSDIMMPQMDGKELCRQIKGNPLTCHIPVLLLTALKSEFHELESLDLGADDFLTKPIRIPILKKRIHNQLESRRTLHKQIESKHLNQDTQFVPGDIATNPLDENFLQKAVQIVEDKMEDPLFDVESFARDMAMSRMTLYRKFKAVIGESPSSFVRSIRMKKAAELLQTGRHNVSEVAIMVGFNDLSSFSAGFKKHFSQSPSEYAKTKV